MGFTALGYCAVVVTEAALYQSWACKQMRKGKAEFLREPSTIQRATPDSVLPQTARYAVGLSEMSLVGRIEIPRIHTSAMVAEGASPRVLRRAVGHVPGTALPGQDGNVALAGHRDTFFRRLGGLKEGDLIRLTTPGGQYWYAVRFTDIVDPDETWVLEPSMGQTLTLVTCYPLHFVGAAPKRFIVRARRLESTRDVQSNVRRENGTTNIASRLLNQERLTARSKALIEVGKGSSSRPLMAPSRIDHDGEHTSKKADSDDISREALW
jgi:sortase A